MITLPRRFTDAEIEITVATPVAANDEHARLITMISQIHARVATLEAAIRRLRDADQHVDTLHEENTRSRDNKEGAINLDVLSAAWDEQSAARAALFALIGDAT